MRKSTCLLAFALGLFGAQAQTQTDGNTIPQIRNVADNLGVVKTPPASNSDRTETTIFSEDFAGGIPSSWSTYGVDGNGNPLTNSVWEYRGPNTTPNNTVGSRGAYTGTTGPIQSPTASNGFVIFDSDFLDNAGIAGNFGMGTAPAPHIGYLESPVINLLNENFVELKMNSYHRYFEGKARIQFSTDGGTTWSVPIDAHPTLGVNARNSPNSVLIIDVSQYIGGQQNAKFRLMFDGTYDDPGANGSGQGYYFWQVDDIEIRELPEFSLRFTNLANGAPPKDIIFKGDGLSSRLGHNTLKQVRPIIFDCNIFNYGYGAQTNVNFEVDILDAANNVVTTLAAPSVSSLAYGDTIDYNTFTTSSSWTPNALGEFSAVLKITSTQTTTAITDTFNLYVTDSLMSLDFNVVSNGIGTATTGEPDGLEIASRFDLENDERLIGVWIGLASTTVDGGFLEVEVYDTTGFTLAAGFTSSPLATASHIVTPTDTTNRFIRLDLLTGDGYPAYLTAGGYYITVRMYSNVDVNPINILNDASVNQAGFTSIFYFPSELRWFTGYAGNRNLNAPFIRAITCPASNAALCMQIGIEELFTEMNLKVGQDDENIFVNFSDVRGNFNLELVDMNGRTLHNNSVKVDNSHRETIGVNHLSPGIYILKVANGEKMNTYKLIIQ